MYFILFEYITFNKKKINFVTFQIVVYNKITITNINKLLKSFEEIFYKICADF